MIDIIYCGNRFIFKGIYLSILSILKRSNQSFRFHIITMSLNENEIRGKSIKQSDLIYLDNLVKKFNKSNEVILYDATKEFNDTIAKSKNKDCYYTPFCMLRFYALNFIDNSIKKAIYLDTDTISNSDISELYDIDISNYELGSVSDFLGRFWVRRNYFNSGVMLLNLDKIRQTNLFKKCIDTLMIKKYFMADQSALNDLVKHRLVLPRKFNEQRPLKKDTVIAHFPKHVFWFWKPIKPWDINKIRNKFKIKSWDDIYKYYLDNFPFIDFDLNKEKVDFK